MPTLLARKPAPTALDRAASAPLDLSGHGAVYAVGDVHGCLDLLLSLETCIEEDAAAHGIADPVIVLLGDFIDRGPKSAAVLNHVLEGRSARGLPVVAIRGNHEDAMVAFADDPQAGSSWLAHGGVETLMSYEADRRAGRPGGPNKDHYVAALRDFVPPAHLVFLRTLPAAAHAHGYRFQHRPPACPAPSPVVHGHVIVPDPQLSPAGINVDLGAYRFGRLCAARIVPDRPPAILEVNRRDGRHRRPDTPQRTHSEPDA